MTASKIQLSLNDILSRKEGTEIYKLTDFEKQILSESLKITKSEKLLPEKMYQNEMKNG
jgi:hypothetical protein